MRSSSPRRTSFLTTVLPLSINALSLVLLFSATFAGTMASLDDVRLGRNALDDLVYRAMGGGGALIAGILLISQTKLFQKKFARWPTIGVIFLVLQGILNSIVLPFFNYGQATFFLFDTDPNFMTPSSLAIDVLILALSAILAFLMVKSKKAPRFYLLLLLICFFFSLFQLQIFQNKYPPSVFKNSGGDESIFEFAPDRENTLVIIPDAFSGSAFSRLIEQNPQFIEGLEGFTAYRKTLARHGGTWGSAPEMVGGPDYEFPKLVGSNRYWYEIYQEALSSLNLRLAKVGSGARFIDGVQQRVIDLNEVDQTFQNALRFTAFQLAPSFYKKSIYKRLKKTSQMSGGKKWSFLLKFLSHAKVAKNNEVKILHVLTPHAPGYMPKGCRLDQNMHVPIIEASYMDESACFLSYLVALKERLKALGVWNNTKLIVVSDHGQRGHGSDFNENMINFGETSWQERGDPGMAHSLLLIKPAGVTGPLIMDDEHFLSSADLFANLCGKFNGCSEMEDPLTFKDRTLRYYIGTEHYELKEAFDVKGNMFDRGSWERVK